jgi:hypothetical protein
MVRGRKVALAKSDVVMVLGGGDSDAFPLLNHVKVWVPRPVWEQHTSPSTCLHNPMEKNKTQWNMKTSM